LANADRQLLAVERCLGRVVKSSETLIPPLADRGGQGA